MRKVTLITITFGLALISLATGCGTGRQNPSPDPPTDPPKASLSITPTVSNIGAGQSQSFVATVSNSASTAVDWSITDCVADCGTITAGGVYTAPNSVGNGKGLKVRATLHADMSVTGEAQVFLRPVLVAITPTTVRLVANSARTFVAVVQYDPANSGVTWNLSGTDCTGDACGTLTNADAASVVYRAPAAVAAPLNVVVRATSVTDSNRSAIAAVMVTEAASQYRLEGNYAFLIQGKRSSEGPSDLGGDVAIVGHIGIDATCNVTGVWDANLQASGGIIESISGSCAVEADGNGTLTLNTGTGKWTFGLAVESGASRATLLPDPATLPDPTPSPLPTVFVTSGYMLRQDTSAFAMSAVEGDRVLALTFMNVGALGRLTADARGTVSNGVMDLTWQGYSINFFTNSVVIGSFSAPDPATGRGTAALTVTPGPDTAVETFHFAYYIVSQAKMLLAETDANTWSLPVLRGEARHQNGAGAFTNASLSEPLIFSLSSDDAGWFYEPLAILGQIRPDGRGNLTETWDGSERFPEDGWAITLEAEASGIYSVEANGRVVLSLPGLKQNNYSPARAVAYLLDGNTGYLIREAIFGTPFGAFEPQLDVSFTTLNLAGTFAAYLAGPPQTFKAERDLGNITLGADGTALVFLNVGGTEPLNGAGTFTVSQNGRGVMSLSDSGTGKEKKIVFWAVSLDRAFAIVGMSEDDSYPVIVELRR